MKVVEFSGPAEILNNYKSGFEKGQTLEESLAAAADAFAQTLESPTAAASLPPGYSVSSGWIESRASGILAVLLSANQLSIQEISDFYSLNGLPGHVPSLDVSDIATVSKDGNLVLADSWVWPAEWSSLWDAWATGGKISSLPSGSPPSGVVAPSGKNVMSDLLLPLLIMLYGG